jgi:BirA family biotin operon repressor/biotin-[acetyl-CoA-carboxylase] ligase
MLEKILAAFYSAKANSLSASQLERETGLPHDELKRSIEELRSLDYVIETHPHRGYRLESAPDRLIPEEVRGRLLVDGKAQEICVGNRIVVFEKTASTNDVVRRMAGERHPEGLVVFAESQTAGRGRHRRKWISPSRKGLWFSILLRPKLPLHAAARLTVMAVVAAVTSLHRITGLPLRIKWPNDILCQRRKLAGILVEAEAQGDRLRHAVIGIGINVNLDADDFSAPLREIATSLKIEAGRDFHRATLAADILLELDRLRHFLGSEKFPALLEQWVERDDTLGRQIALREHGHIIRGQAVGLNPDGALLVRTDDGRTEAVQAGDVEFEKL